MTANTGKEKERKQTEQQQSLKGALAEVLKKSAPIIAPQPKVEPTPESKPVAQAPAKKPFELPEEELRKILKGEE